MTPGPVSTDDVFFPLQSALAGEYSLVRELGRGGMGIVYLAREVRLTRDVALKVLRPELARLPAAREQFLREAQMAARLSHPNIVPIHRVDEAGGFVYIAMALVPGVTLAQQVAAHGPLALHRVVRTLRDVAWALSHAHTAGIIHRDVKADNIMIENGTGRALMTDFGLANVEGSSRAGADEPIVGSAHYVSPEQIGGEAVDARSDIYSFGIAGYLALTGQLPFDGRTVGDVLAKHLSATSKPIRSIATTVPTSLAQVVERCLAREPDHRFQTAADVADALDSAMEPTREIPAQIRVWATREEGMAGSWRFATAMTVGTTTTGAGAALLAGNGWVLLPFLTAGVVGSASALLPVRRVLAAGFGIDDLRAGMRQHWVRRAEELEYESLGRLRAMSVWCIPILGAGLITLGVALRYLPLGMTPATVFVRLCAMAVIGSATLTSLVKLYRRPVTRLGSWHLAFWNSKRAERWVKALSIGLHPRPLASGIPQRTEVALGRATDALFAALPKQVRRELAALPGVVQGLEADARRLRDRLAELDASAGLLPRRAAENEETVARRSRLDADLAAERERLTIQLGTVVAALENIRLDLLRLQLGTGRIESVTATLDAARETAVDLDALADAYESLTEELSPTH